MVFGLKRKRERVSDTWGQEDKRKLEQPMFKEKCPKPSSDTWRENREESFSDDSDTFEEDR